MRWNPKRNSMVLVKRYANRKLYDTQQRRYVTRTDIRGMIQSGMDVRIRDHESGEDLTTRIQARILVDLEKEAQGTLPEKLLSGVIRAGEHGLDQLREYVLGGPALADHVEKEITARLAVLEAHELLTQEEVRRMKDLLLVQSQRILILEARERARMREQDQDALQALRSRLEELEQRIEGLQG